MGKAIRELGRVSGVARIIITSGVLLATILMIAAVFYLYIPGLYALYYSMSLANVASDIFAIVVISGLIGDLFIKKYKSS